MRLSFTEELELLRGGAPVPGDVVERIAAAALEGVSAERMVAQLTRQPELAARVLGRVRVAVRGKHCARVAGPHGAVLGCVYQPREGGWGWWVTRRVDLDEPQGLAETEEGAWSFLAAALRERGWPLVSNLQP